MLIEYILSTVIVCLGRILSFEFDSYIIILLILS